jgi:hypothetical protein
LLKFHFQFLLIKTSFFIFIKSINMKKLITLLALIVITIINAQAPQGFNYQATVRNSSGALITNQSVSFKFSILQNSDTGTMVYSENQTANTDDLGHINLVVGQGTPSTGTFSSINWGSGTYYLGIELNTGSGYVAMGTTQLLSVPYALYANSAGSTTSSSGGFTHYIGEAFGGGVIFHLWKDSLGIEHGLVASIIDLSEGAPWTTPAFQESIGVGPTGQSDWNGAANTDAIVTQAGAGTDYAAGLCRAYNAGGFNDWYLPSISELDILWSRMFDLNKSLSIISGSELLNRRVYYWSSTEVEENNSTFTNISAWCKYELYDGPGILSGKGYLFHVRAIRKF